ncbi:MAG: histidine kinase, partial [Bacteroidota bacterium]
KIHNPENDSTLLALKRAFVAFFFEDSRGDLWFATSSEGVFRFHEGRFTRYLDSLDNDRKLCVFLWETPDGQVLGRHGESLVRYYPNVEIVKEGLRRVGHIGSQYWDSAAGRLLFSYHNGEVGYMEGEKEFPGDFELPPGVTMTFVTGFEPGEYWVGTLQRGAFHFRRPSLDAPPRLVHNYLPNERVTGITRDREGNMWFTTTDNGAFILRPRGIRNYPQLPGGLAGSAIRMRRDQDGHFWMTTNAEQVAVSQGQQFEGLYDTTKWRGKNEYPMLMETKEGRMVVGGRGIFMIRERALDKLRMRKWAKKHPTMKHEICISPSTFQLWGPGTGKVGVEGINGEIYVGTNNSLMEFGACGDYRKCLSMPRMGRYTSLAVDDQGRLFAGVSSSLLMLEGEKLTDITARDSAFGVVITDMKFHSETGLWIATNGRGVANYDLRQDSVYHFTAADGLASDLCSRISLDSAGFVWVATKSGLSRIDLSRNYRENPRAAILSLRKSHGLLSNEIHDIYPDGDTIYACTPKGISVFAASVMEETSPPLSPTITGLKAGETTFEPAEPLSFSHTESTVRFQYRAVSFTNLDNVHYRFRLLPQDSTWRETSERELVFAELPAGDYTFELRAFSDEGDFAESDARLGFTVLKAWWQTWWFRIALGLAVIGLGWLVLYLRYQARYRKSQLENRMLESERKALRAQMNPHFVFNALNSIQNFLAQNDRKAAYTYLARFGKLIRIMLEHSDKPEVPIHDELEALKLYLNLEHLRADGQFEYALDIDPKIRPAAECIPPMLIQPYVENAIWHGVLPCAQPGQITVQMRKEDGAILCRVEDNGIGREAARARHAQRRVARQSFGSRISEERLALLNRQRARNITVSTTDLYAEDGAAAGTRVELYIPILTNNEMP